MAIKVVTFSGSYFPYNDDCMVLRMPDKDALNIEVSFPFHEDTPNFRLSISEALDLRNAIDSLVNLKLLDQPRRDFE